MIFDASSVFIRIILKNLMNIYIYIYKFRVYMNILFSGFIVLTRVYEYRIKVAITFESFSFLVPSLLYFYSLFA